MENNDFMAFHFRLVCVYPVSHDTKYISEFLLGPGQLVRNHLCVPNFKRDTCYAAI